MKKLNLVGQRFGNLIVQSEDQIDNGKSRWICLCDCGQKKSILACHLRSGKIVSCGCYRKQINSDLHRTHGQAPKNQKRTRTYTTWASMLMRCNNPNHQFYHQYGGRGIAVCDRWRKFEKFYEDMGDKPIDHSIERINVDGNYEPGNCRWANADDQANNRTSTIIVNVNGEVMPLSTACRIAGIPYKTVLNRKKMGWTESRWFEPVKTRSRSMAGRFLPY
jgi:hypothetical protein